MLDERTASVMPSVAVFRGYGRRGGCPAVGTADAGVGSGDWLGSGAASRLGTPVSEQSSRQKQDGPHQGEQRLH